MTVQQTTQSVAQQAIRPAAAERTTSATQLSSDFETFLKMLTTQMTNQDPLNPIESSDFAVQLATFSGVEQQVRTNDLLSSLVGSMSEGGLAQLAGWIGREVRSAAPAEFSGAPVTLMAPPATGASQAALVTYDMAGNAVARSTVPVSGGEITWAGVGSDGAPLPPGLYRFEVERWSGETLLGSAPAEHYALVREVRSGPDGAILVLSGDATVPAGEVAAVRTAPSEV